MKKRLSKLKLFCVISVVATMICTSCQESELINEDQLQRNTKLSVAEMDVLYRMRNGENNKIGMEEATEIANEVIGFLDEGIATKGEKSRRIAEVVFLKGSNGVRVMTKSSGEEIEMPDTLAYVFNFADSAGYTIIAADTRIETSVLCYTGSGTLGSDTIENPGLAVFLTGAELYIERSIVDAQQQRDSLLNEILAKIDETGVKDTTYVDASDYSTKSVAPSEVILDEIVTSYSYGSWSVASSVSPLLSVEWGQFEPFNAYIPLNCSDNTSGKAPVGCVAVATSYILTYWFNRWNINFTIDGYNINSNLICSFTYYPNRYAGAASNYIQSWNTSTDAVNARFQLAHLMERIGSRINMSYDCEKGSGANDKTATSYLRSIGFRGGYRADYNVNTMLSSLKNSRPVMIGGFSTKNHILGISWLFWYSGGHSWVIDGYVRRVRPVTITVTTTTEAPGALTKSVSPDRLLVTTTSTYTYDEYSPYYLHNNWGNYSNNGYFAEGCFNSNNPPTISSSTKSGEPHNYQFSVDIFPDIYY